jgi:hypothetical protein
MACCIAMSLNPSRLSWRPREWCMGFLFSVTGSAVCGMSA